MSIKNLYKNLLSFYRSACYIWSMSIPKPHTFVGEPLQCMPMPGVKCPKCTQKGIETWVLQGKNCPKCGHPCKNPGHSSDPFKAPSKLVPQQKPQGVQVPVPVPAPVPVSVPAPQKPSTQKSTRTSLLMATSIVGMVSICSVFTVVSNPILTLDLLPTIVITDFSFIKQINSSLLGCVYNPFTVFTPSGNIYPGLTPSGNIYPGLTPSGNVNPGYTPSGNLLAHTPNGSTDLDDPTGRSSKIVSNNPNFLFVSSSSPLDQFIIREMMTVTISILGNLRVALTNMSVYLLIAGWLSIAFNLIAINNKNIIINNWSLGLETIYSTVHSIVINQINNFKGQIYLPFIYTLFTYILINNLIGMVPYSFAPTSHFILTFSLSFTIVLGATILGFNLHGLKFFSLFVPSGCPLGLLPLLVLIEFISYLSRNVSLGLRLGANILSGHMLLNILSGFTYNIMSTRLIYFFIGLIPLSFIIAFSGLELGIAFIQAQVFVVLTCSYIKDALELH